MDAIVVDTEKTGKDCIQYIKEQVPILCAKYTQCSCHMILGDTYELCHVMCVSCAAWRALYIPSS